MVVLVTRASSNLGRAVVTALAGAGYKVVPAPSVPSDPRAAIAAVIAIEGRLDAVVHIGAAPAPKADPRDVFLRHAWGPFLLGRTAGRAMAGQSAGAVVFVSASRAQLARSPAGAAADRALGALAGVLREQLRPDGLRVALVDVGGAWRRSLREGVGEAQLAREVTRVVQASLRPAPRRGTPTPLRSPVADEVTQIGATVPVGPTRVAAPSPARPSGETWTTVFKDDDLRLDDVATALDDLPVDDEVEIVCDDDSSFDEDTDVATTLAWLVREGHPPHPLVDPVTSVGRARENELQVDDDAQISRRHFLIERRGRTYVLEDDNSGNGTLVDGLPVMSCRLAGGEWIAAGDSRFLFTFERPPKLFKTPAAVRVDD